jgi:hypothetical protein
MVKRPYKESVGGQYGFPRYKEIDIYLNSEGFPALVDEQIKGRLIKFSV